MTTASEERPEIVSQVDRTRAAAILARLDRLPSTRHVREVDDPLFGRVLHAGVVPHVPEDPGGVRWPGPVAGAHTDEVLTELLGLQRKEIAALRTQRAL
jgi:formyl-CoA transferase